MPINSSGYQCHGQLTFGVEYEFYLNANAIMSPDSQAFYTNHPDTPISFAEMVSAAGFVKSLLDQQPILSSPVEVSRTLEPPHIPSTNERQYSAWIVKTDATLIPLFQGNNMPLIGLEVVSPVLSNSSESSWQQAAQVPRTLKESGLVTFTERCGFHVHVGNGQDSFTLNTCKRLYSLLFLGAESILEVLFRDDRRNNEHCKEIQYNTIAMRKPHKKFHLTGKVPKAWFESCFPNSGPEIIREVRTALRKIWKAGNIDEFLAVTSSEHRRAATNFRNVKAGSTGTIEFRKAEGDLDKVLNLEFVASWPQICIGLVAFAKEADRAEFTRVMRETRAALLQDNVEALRLFLTAMGFHWQVRDNLVDRARFLLSQRPVGPLIEV